MGQILIPAGEVVAHEGDVTGGDLKANDAYDLTLVRQADGNFILVMSMKLQFFFDDVGASKWTKEEKTKFVTDWERVVRATWDNMILKGLPNGKVVKLQVMFSTQIGGFMLDHWEISVRKTPAGSQFRSYVNTVTGNVALTINDNQVTVRSVRGQGNYSQVTSVHEFAHMLGLDDEYGPLFGGKKGPHGGDYGSLLNIGSNVRSRHTNHMVLWIDKALGRYTEKSASKKAAK